jgi:hypothetical protein
VTLFAARGLVDAGTERVTKTFRFVASTFSDVRSFEWETLTCGVDENFAYTVAISDIPLPSTVALSLKQSSAPRTCIAARTGIGVQSTATPTAGRLIESPAKRSPT